jgi:UDP-N-acetylmuramate dehydrogenase
MVKALLSLIYERGIPHFILGKGSNLVVSDGGIKGIVISTHKLTQTTYMEECVIVQTGLELSKLVKSTAEHGLSGLEFACGIPGSVGGAVCMNAGAYEGEMSQVLCASEYLWYDASQPPHKRVTWDILRIDDHDFSYRHSIFQDNPFFLLNSTFYLKRQHKRTIQSTINQLTKAREDKQPLELPSAGSVFRRPQGYFTGKLIEDCGLKGYRIGDAAISDKHCGFIVNLGNATATDIKALIEHIQKTVLAKCGVSLQTEIKFIGEA